MTKHATASTFTDASNRIIRPRELAERIGLSLASIWRLRRRGDPPEPIRLSPGCRLACLGHRFVVRLVRSSTSHDFAAQCVGIHRDFLLLKAGDSNNEPRPSKKGKRVSVSHKQPGPDGNCQREAEGDPQWRSCIRKNELIGALKVETELYRDRWCFGCHGLRRSPDAAS